MKSLRELFRIGKGPSSSHTMGPDNAARAADATFYAITSDGNHRISFDHVVEVMKRTGHDLPSLYKETSEGGLALEYEE